MVHDVAKDVAKVRPELVHTQVQTGSTTSPTPGYYLRLLPILPTPTGFSTQPINRA